MVNALVLAQSPGVKSGGVLIWSLAPSAVPLRVRRRIQGWGTAPNRNGSSSHGALGAEARLSRDASVPRSQHGGVDATYRRSSCTAPVASSVLAREARAVMLVSV